jgi:hypothetical protein
MNRTAIITVSALLLLFVVCYLTRSESEDSEEIIEINSQGSDHDDTIDSSTDTDDMLSRNSIRTNELPESAQILTDATEKSGSDIPLSFPHNQLKQFRIDPENINNPDILINELKDNGMNFPIRIRSARDIIHCPSSVKPVIRSTKELFSEINNLYEEIRGHDNSTLRIFWGKGIVVQEIPKGNEYIVRCTDGKVDKMFYYMTPIDLKEISLKRNLDMKTKKMLRSILFAQHAKVGTVQGIVEVGFSCGDPKIPYDQTPFKFIGIKIYGDERADMNGNVASYPVKWD